MRIRTFFSYTAAISMIGIMATSPGGAYGASDRAQPASPAATRDASRVDEARVNDVTDPHRQIEKAIEVVAQMKRDPQLTQVLRRARGVFIAPVYGNVAAVLGGSSGKGVLLVRKENEWSNPVFCEFGRSSVGVQAGATVGSLAMLLMSDRAIKAFNTDRRDFSLDATADLAIANYSAEAHGSADKNDVIVWSDTAGLLAGVSIGISSITRDEAENRVYYGQSATTQQIFAGNVKNPHAQSLREALPDRLAGR